jgi:hypothetical protein
MKVRTDKFRVGDMVSFLTDTDINYYMLYQIEQFEEIFGDGPYLLSAVKDVPLDDQEQVGHTQVLFSDRWFDSTKFSGGWFFAIPRLNEVMIRVE